MADLHIDDFYRDVATIFLRLYALFPRKSILYVEDICGPDEPDEFGLHNPRFQAAFSAIVWLADHGYLNFHDTIRQEAVDQVVLSQRAFLLLNTSVDTPSQIAEEDAPPSLIAESRTAIAHLRQVMKTGTGPDLRDAVYGLLSRPPVGGH